MQALKKIFISTIFLTFHVQSFAISSDTIRVLFIGNSYTYVNDLPLLVKQIGSSQGKIIKTEQDTPGGCTLEDHWESGIPQSLIKKGKWDYMVLQEQSQRPSMPIEQFNKFVFPYVHDLDSLFKAFNPKGETILYMTWGRKDGDIERCASWGSVCTYKGMDDLTRERYIIMANQNNSLISPVGAVWRYLRKNNSEIELYLNDGSHPSLNGSFAGALTFFTIITKTDPLQIQFNAGISFKIASTIKEAVKKVAYDSLFYWNGGEYAPHASFSYRKISARTILFDNQSYNSTNQIWYFGDGQSSSENNPEHYYSIDGIFKVVLMVKKNNLTDTVSLTIPVLSNNQTETLIYPNPSQNDIKIFFEDTTINNYELQIIDRLGNCIEQKIIKSKTYNKIGISNFSPGIYFALIKIKGKIIYFNKFIKIN